MTDTFQDLGLPAHLLRALDAQAITTPTPIQSQAIPHAMNGRDVMGLAQTGTGKTNAFGLPLVAQMLEMRGKPAPHTVRGLVLAPTRELAKQIQDQLALLIKGTPLKVALVVGGASLNAQANRLARGTDILVATPGRLLDLLDRRALTLSEARFLVLDEADQMLDMGFIHALRKIASLLPEERQTMLFSATMPKQMEEIAQSYLVKPARVQVNPPGKPADKIEQEVHFIAKGEKLGLLKELLDSHRDDLALVFGRTKHGMEKLARMLEKAGFSVAAIHGNKSQGQRQRALEAFKEGRVRVLVATDVAARGLDIPEVRHVYNYELPNVPDNYVHRIGRTARAGRDGRAIAFCSPEEMGELKDIQKVMKREIPVASGTPWEKIAPPQGQGQGPKPQGGRGKGKPGGARRAQQRRRSRAGQGRSKGQAA
ncbi:DEAD/DEAH box helicase [Lutimaribacter saemankumensis]|uniref:ATP-dependent RNA helicase RhlE n=1 Tax=Lutimaribacter saemankumensis TaxID=490829 RepID=A0A1G8HE43_9RHOB|nr:DEAD/DEAH box helicase [Lutimaribacter saemankumensis]SDI04957.1 ATP-dependent RNA helicase RhlE [Lutimaribacter saemankumensis]